MPWATDQDRRDRRSREASTGSDHPRALNDLGRLSPILGFACHVPFGADDSLSALGWSFRSEPIADARLRQQISGPRRVGLELPS